MLPSPTVKKRRRAELRSILIEEAQSGGLEIVLTQENNTFIF